MSLRIRVGDQVVGLTARRVAGEPERFTVHVDDTALEVTARVLPDGALLLGLGDGRQVRAEVTRDGDARWVSVAGRTALLHHVEGDSASATEDEPCLEAPMPGRVAAVEVQPGDTVSAGDTLVVVEAMKMEHPIRAPRDGVVAQVNAEVGVMVSPGAPLVVLEDES